MNIKNKIALNEMIDFIRVTNNLKLAREKSNINSYKTMIDTLGIKLNSFLGRFDGAYVEEKSFCVSSFKLLEKEASKLLIWQYKYINNIDDSRNFRELSICTQKTYLLIDNIEKRFRDLVRIVKIEGEKKIELPLKRLLKEDEDFSLYVSEKDLYIIKDLMEDKPRKK